MHLRYRSVLPLVAICTALAVAPAFAAKQAPTTLKTQPATHAVGQQSVLPCQLGIAAPSNSAFGYILPPDDGYYTLLDPSTCTDCAGGPLQLVSAHVEHFFPLGELPCDIPVKISIVAAVDPGDGCLAPNPFDQVCPEQCYIIGYPGIDDACVDFSFPLPANCCINGPVFLEIKYAATECNQGNGTCPSGRPAFCGQNPEITGPCHQYNIYPGGNDDLALAIGRNVTMWAAANCCVVPTIPGSWGKVKTLYR
jgi:hypothetical protein